MKQTVNQYLALAQEYEQQANLDKAIAIYRQTIEEFPHNYRPYNCLGKALTNQGNLDQAIAIFRQGIELKPDFPWLYFHLAQTLTQQNELTEAIINYQKAIALEQDCPWFYVHLGDIWYKQGNLIPAMGCYQKAISLKLEDPWLHQRVAQVYVEQGQFAKAIDSYYQGIEINPDISNFYEQIYFLQERLKRGDMASDVVRSNIPKNISLEIQSLEQKAELLQEEGELELALQSYQKIIDLDCNYGKILSKIGNIQEKLQRTNLAQLSYQQANFYLDFKANNKTLLVCFSARHLGDRCRFHFLDLLWDINCKKLFVRDLQDAWYNKGLPGITQNIEETVDYLKTIISQQNVDKVVFLGSSSGGYAALLLGYLAEVDEIHAFGSQTKIPSNSEEAELLKGIEPNFFDLTKVYQSRSIKTACHLYFDDRFSPDKNHAHYLKDTYPVELHGYSAGIGHKIALWLNLQDMLKPIILNAIDI